MTSLHVIKSQFFIYHDNLNLQPSKRGELRLWYKKKEGYFTPFISDCGV